MNDQDSAITQIHSNMRIGDIALIAQQLAAGIDIDIRDQQNWTPLMYAASNTNISLEVVNFLIANGADVNAIDSQKEQAILGLAAKSGAIEKVRLLLDAGANIGYRTKSGYDVLINAIFAEGDIFELLKLLIDRGAPLDGKTKFGESALSVLSRTAQFDKVGYLLTKGCNPERLQWTALMRSIAIGTVTEVQQELSAQPNLAARDRWKRTPWLLSIHTGDIEKVKILWTAAINPSDRGNCGQTALILAVESGNLAILQWLIDQGFEINEVDDHGTSALAWAILQDAVNFVVVLLRAGADPKQVRKGSSSNLAEAKSMAVTRLLIAAGEDFNQIPQFVRRLMTKVTADTYQISSEQYQIGKQHRFGATNPELMLVDFWRSMVCNVWSAWRAKNEFDEPDNFNELVWCYQRFGQSITELPDGRIIEIAGGHEDSYDPDFCIYNDVVVYDGQGDFQIFGYPQAVFPPTDFHTATLVGDYIYIIGNIGYYQNRNYGQTPVYRLDCRSYQIEPVITTGNNPGWIYRHRADYQEPGVIVISGGSIKDAQESHENLLEYRLNLASSIWQ